MMRTRVLQTVVLSAAVLSVAACGGSSTSATGSTSTPKASSASPSASASASSAAAPAQIKVATTSQGSVLTDDKGRVLYMFSPDNQGDSVCYDQCAAAWPPTLTGGAPTAGTGADASLLGTTARKDGTTQVTYNKYPLYTFAFDPKPGDVNGQADKSIWWVLNAAGKPIQPPAKVAVGAKPVGKVLTDVRGQTLYMFAQDKKGVSSCAGDCLKSWIPYQTAGAPTAGTGVKAGLLGTTKTTFGATQVTYNKLPLYFFGGDQAPTDTKGQAFKKLWYVVDGKGAPIKKAP
jgi:predicted lipoprotein with Yx(FWY)xxD motif